MSLGPVGGILGSAVGAPLSQTKGSSEERAARDAATQEKTDSLDLQAEKSSGVGQTEGDSETSDRDADGRRLWEAPEEGRKEKEEGQADDESTDTPPQADNDDDEHHLDLIA